MIFLYKASFITSNSNTAFLGERNGVLLCVKRPLAFLGTDKLNRSQMSRVTSVIKKSEMCLILFHHQTTTFIILLGDTLLGFLPCKTQPVHLGTYALFKGCIDKDAEHVRIVLQHMIRRSSNALCCVAPRHGGAAPTSARGLHASPRSGRQVLQVDRGSTHRERPLRGGRSVLHRHHP